MRYKRSGQYKELIHKLKWDDIGTRKCGYHFKLYGYHKKNNTCIFNLIYGVHSHGLYHNLFSHLIVCRLNAKEKRLVFS